MNMKHKETTDSVVHNLVIAAVPFLVYASVYRALPSEIPVHYSFDGIADRFVSKLSVEALLHFCDATKFGSRYSFYS